MANLILNNVFRIALSTLNFVSPSLIADVILHPFDFATVLLQIGYNPEGIKYETATLVSVIVQYALFTFYIPYLLTSIQGLHFSGMPHPSIFYYVNYIYNKEGFLGCYRGVMPKICERLIMVSVNEKIKRSINKDLVRSSQNDLQAGFDQENFLQTLINGVCSQFFAVLASHPFHVLMVSSFAEFTYSKKSSIIELCHSIYKGDGYFGFFTGLTARLLGELLSLIFSVTYTAIINKQMRPRLAAIETPEVVSPPKAPAILNYVTDISRFTAFKHPKSMEEEVETPEVEENTDPHVLLAQEGLSRYLTVLYTFLGNIMPHNSYGGDGLRETRIRRRRFPLMAYIPLTSKLFYYIMIRDFLSRKISNPFFLVCHCAIALGSGWDKFPLKNFLRPLANLIQVHLVPQKKLIKM